MSGFIGILRLDGRDVDGSLLRSLTESLSYRGPDGNATWCEGPVGLGQSLLKVSRTSPSDARPFTLQGDAYVVGDVRIDDRDYVMRTLRSKGRSVASDIPDLGLLLHAYAVWGTACTEHLIGDFSFLLWDRGRSRLFCARDHFGVRPFYYARTENQLIFSNTLRCILDHPDVDSVPNDVAIGDFLLFECNVDPSTSWFEDVYRLPPAHRLTCTRDDVVVERYWSLPTDQRLRYRRDEEYVEHFREVVRTAVADRTDLHRVGIFQTGGMDSATIAATLQEIQHLRGSPSWIKCYTAVRPSLAANEKYFAGLVADHLGLPIDYIDVEALEAQDGIFVEKEFTGTLQHHPLRHGEMEMFRHMSRDDVRVGLSGFGVLDHGRRPIRYFINVLKQGWLIQFARDVFKYRESFGRWPRMGIRTALKRRLDLVRDSLDELPAWIRPEFSQEHELSERFAKIDLWGLRGMGSTLTEENHFFHPESYAVLLSPLLTNLLENKDPGSTRIPLDVRYPFMDLRVVNFILGLPPVPWVEGKRLVRRAMRDQLPLEIVQRPKTPLGNGFLRGWQNNGSLYEVLSEDCEHVQPYVDPVEFQKIVEAYKPSGSTVGNGKSNADLHKALRLLSLNRWLRQRSSSYRKSTLFLERLGNP